MIECQEDFDNGQNDVTDGSVENYDFDWNEENLGPDNTEVLDEVPQIGDNREVESESAREDETEAQRRTEAP